MSKEEIRNARKADLYGFILSNHPTMVNKLGRFLQLKNYDSVFVKKGFSGFIRNSTGESGNPVDFLVKYLGYSFTDAIKALNDNVCRDCDIPQVASKSTTEDNNKSLPIRADQPYSRVIAYLTSTRKISGDTIFNLIKSGLIYQDIKGNAVFINRLRNYCEIRGTYSHIKYHQILKTDDSAPCWYFTVGQGVPKFFICESSIDAISLYELQKLQGTLCPGHVFCSIGGAGKQNTISLLEKQRPGSLVLAVDNDSAGEECRHRNPRLPFLLPLLKDWNEDLIRYKEHNSL
ncbi:MAG: toprim domain-containing protein [Aeriscardovia sp.]|nr:toprim domain-containing protein [Aeriscardovia sp.]